MQTSVGVFGGEAYTDGIGEPPLMTENVGHSDHPAVSSMNCPPFIAVELCREQIVRNFVMMTNKCYMISIVLLWSLDD